MTRFTITDMDCESCAAAITRAVRSADPAAKLSADVAAQSVEIQSRLDAATLAGLIGDAGFTVREG